jgi:hypothetical protein
MRTEEIGCWSDALFLMESRGFSKEDAAELALQLFNFGVSAAYDRMRPSRPMDLPALPPPSQAAAPAPASTPAPAKKAKPKREPAKGLHRMPADFDLGDDMRAFATERAFPPAAINMMWLKFTNHYRANGATAVDWKAKWRTWVLKTVEFNTRDGRTPSGSDATSGGFL